MEIKLRGHHLFCTALYQGAGYSPAFCRQMERVIHVLKQDADASVLLQCGTDDICRGCPNLTAEQTCASGQADVLRQDKRILEGLGLTPGTAYPVSQLRHTLQSHLTQALFLQTCGGCSWRRQGVCRYEDLLKAVHKGTTWI